MSVKHVSWDQWELSSPGMGHSLTAEPSLAVLLDKLAVSGLYFEMKTLPSSTTISKSSKTCSK